MTNEPLPYFEVPTSTFAVVLTDGRALAIEANNHEMRGAFLTFYRWRAWGKQEVCAFGAESVVSYWMQPGSGVSSMSKPL